ncbi:hypothetical protein [Mesorhizobium denitrificans]|uniref:Uncharacterized protein n=1 Tax=Mesorhizobium denitrificans TaxID=2294114 RepID=A0A371X6C7_9HYPH|nr:hypothetical protein [Mesorhizobium denitrificans]RFC64775.1 hypothetical protein DY251_18600 [Mesorhizobium denitrificans]
MPDFEYLDLYAKFAGFRILALANRLSCDDEFSRRAHDKLVVELDELIRVTRRILAAEHTLASDPDANREDLGETIWCAEQELTCYQEACDGIDLIDNHIFIDWETKEWHDLRTGHWYSLHDFDPPRIKIGDDRLNGLCKIIADIAAETGIRFNAYANESSFPHEEEDVDPECYEDLQGHD